MLRNYYINREFIVSATARRVYRAAASLSLAMFVLLFAVILKGRIPENVLPIVRPLMFAGAIGTAITTVAMEYFLVGFDKSSATKRALWFLLINLVPVLGPALYCFLVYSRSEVVTAIILPESQKNSLA